MPQFAAELHSRPPFERMMRIHDALKAGCYPNCTQLAKVIEVSTRTIKRDVDFMKFRLDLPIDSDLRLQFLLLAQQGVAPVTRPRVSETVSKRGPVLVTGHYWFRILRHWATTG